MKDVIKNSLILVAIVTISGMFLSLTDSYTNPIIKSQNKQRFYNEIHLIFPHAERTDLAPLYSEGKLSGEYYNIYNKYDRIIGYVIKKSEKGYKSEIEILAGFDKEKNLVSVLVLEQEETPGLGSKVASESFLDQFIGKEANDMRLRQEGGTIDAITGATRSSEAAAAAIRKAVEEIR